MKAVQAYLMIVLALGLSSCKDNSTGPTVDQNLNAPVITNVTSSFTYSVRASNFTENVQGVLSFTSDSLIVTRSSTEYLSGSVIVSIKDTLNSVVFADTVQSNKVTAIAGLKTTKPKSYSISVANLTGKFVFVVVGQ